jgi:threonine dehydrogenase-like Zn-dependent dehydrogenase
MLRLQSPSELAATDPRTSRMAVATAAGATRADTGALPPGEYDVVIETAGAAGSAVAAVGLPRRGGRVVLAGIPGSATGIPPSAIVGGQLTVASVFGASSAAWVHAVRLFTTGLLELSSLVTHEFELGEFGRAAELLETPRDDVGKILIRP